MNDLTDRKHAHAAREPDLFAPPLIGAGACATPATLLDVLRLRAGSQAADIAYTFLAGGSADAASLTWGQLDRRAGALGASLSRAGAQGEPVLLVLSSGLAFVESLFACWYAGAIPVPVCLPRHHRTQHRLDGIVADAGARFAIGTADCRQRLSTGDPATMDTITWIDPTADAFGGGMDSAGASGARPASVALLQYTSGSTCAPRGVMVTHANLMRNSALIAQACGHGPGQTIGGWLPLFHDMGLIGLVLQAAFAGARCVFMSPERFLMRPRQWLQMISDYGICSSPAPNFAYDLCVDRIAEEDRKGLDLSGWRNALNGSEPVRAATLERFRQAFASCGFRREAFFPCYGLAESTLFVTGPGPMRRLIPVMATTPALAVGGAAGEQEALRGAQGPDALVAGTQANATRMPAAHVGCGQPLGDTRLAVVDPQTLQRVPASAIGEIWIAGESCAVGYWNNPAATAATFGARIARPADAREAEIRWLRTGDLGFIAHDNLFITGRLRDLIIISGRNHFPIDLERTVEAADPAIAAAGTVAFSIDVGGLERLVVAAEVRREVARSRDAARAVDVVAICRRLRAAIVAEHEVSPHEIVLLAPGTLPRTTSGKISRHNVRQAYRGEALERWAEAKRHV